MATDDQELVLEVLPALPDGATLDHCQLAIGRLIAQYRGQPFIETVLCIAGDRYTELDRQAGLMLAFRGLGNAFGVGLDRIGLVLRWARDGLDDDTYRIRLRAAAQVRASHGRPDEVLGVLLTLLDGAAVPTFEEHYPAAVVLEAAGIPDEDGFAFARMIRGALAAGVLLNLLHNAAGVTLFGWDEDPGAGPWAETDGDPAGGIWAHASGPPGT